MTTAYHHPRFAMPAVWLAAASRSLRVCDAMRVTTPGISDTKCRDTKGEVDSKAEVNGR